jgi:opine dehydrogenase
MHIAVLGGGNGSLAAAADLSLAGHEVRLWRRDPAQVTEHLAAGRIIALKDFSGRREAQLSSVTAEIGKAVNGAELILCPVPATAHPDVAKALAPHLADRQVVLLTPGTFGSVLFAKAAHEAGNRADVAYAETGTLPWLARKRAPREVAVTVRAKRLPTGVFPLSRADRALAVIKTAFPGIIEPCGDALSGALMNAGPIIHPPLIIMNAGPLAHFDSWDIHNEGTQPEIRRVTDALDRERISIREALGYGAPHFPLVDHYATAGEEWMYGRGSHDRLTESGDWRERIVLTQHRYMLEDTRLGLSFLASVAALSGIATPLTQAFLAIGSAVCGEDFNVTGRTLAGMGLGHLNVGSLQQLLRAGFA